MTVCQQCRVASQVQVQLLTNQTLQFEDEIEVFEVVSCQGDFCSEWR